MRITAKKSSFYFSIYHEKQLVLRHDKVLIMLFSDIITKVNRVNSINLDNNLNSQAGYHAVGFNAIIITIIVIVIIIITINNNNN